MFAGVFTGGTRAHASSTARLVLSGTTSVTAGTPFGLSVVAVTSGGQVDPTYTGDIAFTSSDGRAALPSDYTFTSADAGSHTFTGVVLNTAGTQTITVTDTATSAINGTLSYTVSPGALYQLAFTVPANVAAAAPFTGAVTAEDAEGNVETTYAGTVAFSSSDLTATLPPNHTFNAGDKGTHTFANGFTLNHLGSQSVTVSDAGNSLTTPRSIIVSGPAVSLAVSFPACGATCPTTHVAYSPAVVTAKDINNNTAVGYTGTITFSSSTDGTATLPSNYTFTAADAGTHSFAVTFDEVGLQSLTATDMATGTIAGTSSVTVRPGAATQFVLTLPATVSNKVAFTVTATAEDQYGDVATGYTGSVTLSSATDGSAVFAPSPYTFSGADAGIHNFSATLDTTGSQTITVTDTVHSGITGSGMTTVAVGGPAASFKIAVPAAASAGQSFSFRVTAVDGASGSGNTSTVYRGTVNLTSTDGLVSFTPSSTYTFTAADAGVHVFTATMSTTGNQTITVTDSVTSSVTGTSAAVPVAGLTVAGGGFFVTVTATPGPHAVAGTPVSVTVTAHDSAGRTTPSYTGTVAITSTDSGAGLPANHTFTTGDCGVSEPAGLDCGTHVFALTFHTTGSWTVTATDTTTTTVTGTSSSTTVDAGAATQLVFVSPPSTATAGSAFSVTVRAQDSSGNTATGYTGMVGFSSSDHSAMLTYTGGSPYTFVGGDNGQHTFTNAVTLFSAGSRTLTATDTANSLTVSTSITVNPSAAAAYVLTAPTDVSAGTAFTFKVTATDAYANTVPTYTGTVHFTSSDGAAALPADYPFVAGDNGVHTFSATLNTPRHAPQTVTGTDTSVSSITGTASILTSGSASSLVVNAPASTTAGTPIQLTVTAYDPFNNVAVSYTGTVHFTSTDAHAALPSDYTFTSDASCEGLAPTTDCGSHSFAATLNTSGAQTLTASDALNHLTNDVGVQVNPGPAASLSMNAPSNATSAVAFSVTLTALDAEGNQASGYAGTVHFTSADAQAALPPDYTFTSGDAGAHTFSVTLNTAGSQSVTATDSAHSLAGGATVSVAPGPAARLTVTAPVSTTSATAFTVTVTALDAHGNVATGYTGTVHFTSTDAAATLPPDHTFTGPDAGQQVFPVTLVTAGIQTVTATDSGNSFTAGANVQVNPGPATRLGLVAQSATTAGYAFNVTVTAADAQGNVATAYAGTVHFTSSDAQATLPADYSFTGGDAGQHVFSVTLRTAGSQSVTVTDTVTSSMTSSATIVVNSTAMVPGAPTNVVAVSNTPGHVTLTWTPPANSGSSSISGYSVITHDEFNNVVATTPVASSPAALSGLLNGEPYYFSVAAVNAVGTGAATQSFSTTPSSGAAPPAQTTATGALQYFLPNSDGVTWQKLDEAHQSLSMTPVSSESVLLSANADLWTAQTGYNQDLGIMVSVNGGAPTLVAWKESGGFGGTFSPNAAYVQTVYQMSSGSTYDVWIVWKTNKPALGVSIAIGAGPSGPFSNTTLNAQVLTAADAVQSAVSTQQYSLTNSDGTTWTPIDATNLKLTVAPSGTEDVVIGGNADLWTWNAGYNQDIGISVNGTVVAWKESGGFAGTFSPNAAFVQTVTHLTAGSYTVELVWKANQNAPGVTISAGAGPINAQFSPTRLTVYALPAAAGTWAAAASTLQYHLTGNNGTTWVPMDSANLATSLTAASSGNVVVSANTDLWTATAGLNQDVAVFVTDNGGPPTLIGWKESGGFAGTYSPNAAFLQVRYSVVSGHTYRFTVEWKANTSSSSATIYAGAGPLGGAFSPTGIAVVPD